MLIRIQFKFYFKHHVGGKASDKQIDSSFFEFLNLFLFLHNREKCPEKFQKVP